MVSLILLLRSFSARLGELIEILKEDREEITCPMVVRMNSQRVTYFDNRPEISTVKCCNRKVKQHSYSAAKFVC